MKTVVLLWLLWICSGWANQYYVKTGVLNGNGSLSSPFNNLQSALLVAHSGDSVLVFGGVYSPNDRIVTVRAGTPNAPITVMALNPTDLPVFTRSGKVISVSHEYIHLKNLIFDGQMGDGDIVRIYSGADHLRISGCEIRYGLRDGIDMSAADHVIIENCHIHHLLAGSYTNQLDAHGIVATGEKHLLIRGCNIHHVSGDCFQTDPNRTQPLWDDVRIENSRLWTGPLDSDYGAWHAGEIPGENAVDTKICTDSLQYGYRPVLHIKKVTAYGFEPGYISNRAAFNIKEQVDCQMEEITVYNNEIAFRLRGDTGRGSAWVKVMNSVAFANEKVFRVEDGLEKLLIYNSTFDAGTGIYFNNVAGGYQINGFDLRNSLFIGTKPPDASHPSNLAVGLGEFLDPANGDYHLLPGSIAIDAGEDIPQVVYDMDGEPRPPGFYDVGADEYYPATNINTSLAINPGPEEMLVVYPNPFNPITRITITVKRRQFARLIIFNMLGQQVQSLFSDYLTRGTHRFFWNGKDAHGAYLPNGFYFIVLQTSHHYLVRKVVFIK